MSDPKLEQRTISILDSTYLRTAADTFIIDRKAQRLAPGTQTFYTAKLKVFLDYCDTRAIKTVEEITQCDIRDFLLWLEGAGHNPGGVHTFYRAVKTFLLWIENDLELEEWSNPIRKVKAPRIPKEPLEGLALGDFQKLLNACEGDNFTALRDSALIRFLLDTGARASETLAVMINDTDFITGRVLIRQGKGRKPRYVYMGKRTRKAIRRYTRARQDPNPALWIAENGTALGYSGLRLMLHRRAKSAGINTPTPHDFRRCFALEYLRAGGDIFTLQKIMGHTDIQVLRRYLAQTDSDTQGGHALYAPVDRL